MSAKRPQSESALLLAKRTRIEDDPNYQQLTVAATDEHGKGALIQSVRRTSGLSAPIMVLRVSLQLPLTSPSTSPSTPTLSSRGVCGTCGREIRDPTDLSPTRSGTRRRDSRHQVQPRWRVSRQRFLRQDHPPVEDLRRLQEVSAPSHPLHRKEGRVFQRFLSLPFSPSLTDPFLPRSYGILRTGKGTPTSLAFTSPTTLLAGCSDHTLFLFDLKSGDVLRRFRGHKAVVNAVDVQRGGQGRGLIASASDDGTVRVWSQDAKEEIEVVELGYPITAVRFLPFFSLIARTSRG
jgi:WD40 repeat protein